MRHLYKVTGVVASLSIMISGPVFSQEMGDAYPSKPVTLIMGTAAGGPGDQETRLYAEKLGALLGQSFVLDFKPGAGGTLGANYVAKAKPDGYTLLVATASFTTFPVVFKNLGFDTLRDFSPVSQMSRRTTVLLAHPTFQPKSFVEYIAYAKANPGKINFGTAGSGSGVHLAGEWMHSVTDTKVTFVHYKGTADAFADLFSGRLDVSPVNLLSAIPLIKAGKVRPLAVLTSTRSKLLPDVATIAEQGIPGYDYQSWQGALAPGLTPSSIVNKLSDGFSRAAKAPDVAKPLEAEGSVTVGSTPVQFRQFIIIETERWQKLVKDSRIQFTN